MDYKFFCFNGKAKFFKVDFGRFVEHHANYYSLDGTLLSFGEKGLLPLANADIAFPKNLSDMIKLSEALSANMPFLRVDLYNVSGKIYFGELTFYPASGLLPWVPCSADSEISKFLRI